MYGLFYLPSILIQHCFSGYFPELCNLYIVLKVHLTPKYFFRLTDSLHQFETHCAFLPFSRPNLDFLQAVKVKKSGHRLFHDRASKGNGFISGLMS